MSRVAGLRPAFELAGGLARSETGGVIAVENATLSDANYPVAKGISCKGYQTILVGAEIDGGAAPSITVEPLFRDAQAVDGKRWKRIFAGALPGVTPAAAAVQLTPALVDSSDLYELQVFGWDLVYLRVQAVVNAAGTTGFRVLAFPGRKL